MGTEASLPWTRPVTELTSVARRYGQGERHLRASVSGNDELAELAKVFNQTAGQLQMEQDEKQRP